MKKALLAAAIAAAVAVPAANAGVVVYGKVHGSIDYLDNSGSISGYTDEYNYLGPVSYSEGGESFSQKGWYVASRASRLGFKGTEDLGNGLSLIWKYETGVDIADSPKSGGIFSGARNSYIGLSGDWGTFLYGRHDTPMKISTGRLDLFSDQLGDYNYRNVDGNNTLLGPGFKDVRADNAIAYISPNWNGFTAAAAIIPGENSGNEANGLADAYSIAGMYSNNGLYLAAAYEQFDSDLVGVDMSAYKQWRVGAGYTINAFTLNAVYENQKGGVYDDVSSENDIWQVSAAYDFGNNRIKVAYGENKGDTNWSDSETVGPVLTEAGFSGDTKRKSWAIGWDHKLSKRTTAYAQYAAADNSGSLDASEYKEDLRTDGNRWGQTDTGLNIEEDISGFSMGMIHTF